jgi:hypothetical protein
MNGPLSEYRLLSVIPVTDMLAVWAVDHPDGGFYLESEPLHFIGLAEWKHYIWEGRRKKYLEDYGPTVVGLCVSDGYFHVCEEFEDFAGMCHVGDDITEATGSLHRDGKGELKPAPA